MGLSVEMSDGGVEKLAARVRADPLLLGGWRRRRAAEQLACTASPQAVAELARALVASSDQRVVEIALASLRELSDQGAIDAACQVWDDTRDPTLKALLVEHGWVASGPAALRVSTALHGGRMDVLAEGDAQIARALVTVTEEDPALRERARAALRALRRPEARDAVCALAIDQDNPVALEAAAAGDFASDPVHRAMVFYLAGEFDRYAELDFDGSLLAAAHATAGPGLRTRLADRARESGRVEWVRAVAGRHARLEELCDREWATAIGVLVTAGQWNRLWQLALRAPPIWGVRMLGELGRRDWHPEIEVERVAYRQLSTLAGQTTKLSASPACTPPFAGSTVLSDRSVRDLVVSPDGGLLASGSWDQTVRLWRLPSGESAGTLIEDNSPISSLAISPDGTLLASGCWDRTVRLWRLPSGEPAGALTGHTDQVRCLAVSPDGGLLASGGDKAVRLWRLPCGEPAGTLLNHQGPHVQSLAISPDGTLLASCDGWTVHLSRLPSGEHAGTLYDHTSSIHALAISPDGTLLASGGDRTVQLWRLPSGEPAGTLIRRDGLHVCCLAVSPDGRLLASGSLDGRVRLWRLPSGEFAGTLTGHTSAVVCLLITPDGQLLASASKDETIRLWRSTLLALIRTPVGKIGLAEIGRLLQPTGDHPDSAHAWIELITMLVQWGHRFDIEEADAAPGAVRASASDIELDS